MKDIFKELRCKECGRVDHHYQCSKFRLTDEEVELLQQDYQKRRHYESKDL
jgi:hypothetical protein